MSSLQTGQQVRVIKFAPQMPQTLKDIMDSGEVGEVVRVSRRVPRVLVRFNVADANFGMYWLESDTLDMAS